MWHIQEPGIKIQATIDSDYYRFDWSLIPEKQVYDLSRLNMGDAVFMPVFTKENKRVRLKLSVRRKIWRFAIDNEESAILALDFVLDESFPKKG